MFLALKPGTCSDGRSLVLNTNFVPDALRSFFMGSERLIGLNE